MNLSRHPYLALVAALCALPVHATPTSKAAVAETAAARQERAARAEFVEKQKKLFEEKGIAVDAPVRQSSTIVELPQDETDAPNAVQK
jgi:hypothetical protein